MKLPSLTGFFALAGLAMMMAPVPGFALQTLVLSGLACQGEHFSDFDSTKPLYSLRIVTEKGKKVDRLSLTDTDNDGKPFSVQTVDFENEVPKTFVSTNRLLKEENKMTVTDKELILVATRNGKTKEREMPRPKLFAVGPSINRIITDSLPDLAAGKSISFQMVLVDRLTTYGFRLVRERPKDREPLPQVKSGQWLKLRMEIEDPFLGVFAPKIYFIVDAKTGMPQYVSSPIPSPRPGQGMLGRGTIHYQLVRSR